MNDQPGAPGSRPPAPWEADTFAPPPAATPPAAPPEPGKPWPVELSPRPALPTTIRAILGATFDAYAADLVPILALSALYAALSVLSAVNPLLGVVLAVATPVVTSMLVAVAGERLRTGSVRPRQAVAAGIRRAGWVFVWSFLVGLAIGGLALLGTLGALFAFGIGAAAGGPAGALLGGLGSGAVAAAAVAVGLFLLARWSLAIPNIVLNGEGPLSGSQASTERVRGRTTRMAALLVVAGVVTWAPTLVAFVPALLARGDAAVVAVTGALGILTYPVLPIAFTVAYARLERVAVEPPRPRSRLAPVLAVATGGIVAISLAVGAFGVAALATDVSNMEANRGRVLAGTGLEVERCRLVEPRERFELGEGVAVLAVLDRRLAAGAEITLVLVRDGVYIGSATDSFETAVDCVGGTYTAADISLAGGPGRYLLEYRLGDELLATGGFEVVTRAGSSAAPSAAATATPLGMGLPTPAPTPTSTPGGTIHFGTGAGTDACVVAGETARFSVGQLVFVAADLGRSVAAGSEVRIGVRYDGTEIAADAATLGESTACLDGSLPTSGLPAGRYTVEYGVDGEVLAGGEFELVP